MADPLHFDDQKLKELEDKYGVGQEEPNRDDPAQEPEVETLDMPFADTSTSIARKAVEPDTVGQEFMDEQNQRYIMSLEEKYPEEDAEFEDEQDFDSALDSELLVQRAVLGEVDAKGRGRNKTTIAQNLAEIPRGTANGLIEGLEDLINLPGNLIGADDIVDLPQFSDEQTGTGQTVHAAAEFLGSFGMWGKILTKVKGFKDPRALTTQAAKGALADFTVYDQSDRLLTDLIEKYPAELRPVMEMIQTNPNDPVVINKAKAALEGTLFGVAADKIVDGMRAVYNAKSIKGMLMDKVRVGTAIEEFVGLGDINSEELILKKIRVDEKQAAEMTPEDLARVTDGEEEMYINWARINESDDVKSLIQQMADLDKKGIDKARRGEYRSWAKVKLDANELNNWKVLEKRMKESGVALNDAENLALRELWVASGRKLQELSSIAKDSSREVDHYAFRKMLAVHYAIQKEAIGARTEAARALAVWRMDVKGDALELNDSLIAILEENGGKDVSASIARKIDQMAKMNPEDLKNLDSFIEKSLTAKTTGAIAQIWINGLLSNPTTHVVNFVSNAGVLGMGVVERGVAARIRALAGGDGVEAGEAISLIMGMKDGFVDIVTAGKKSLTTPGEKFTLLSPDASHSLRRRNKIEKPNSALSAEAVGVGEDTALGQTFNLIDKMVGAPGAALQIGDEFYKSFGYRSQISALAQRETRRALKEGKIKPDEAEAFRRKLIDNPDPSIKAEAVDHALYQTFTKDPDVYFNKLGDGVRALNGVIPGLGTLILPFKRTPINIATYTLERTPFAPLVSEWNQAIKAGGAQRDLAVARMGTGSLALLTMMDLALSGRCTGGAPDEPGAKAHFMRTKQEYSCLITNEESGEPEWVSYSRTDPAGSIMAIGADMATILTNMEGSDVEEGTDAWNTLVAAMFSTANILVNKTYMENVSQFIAAVKDDKRYAESFATKVVGSAIPAGVAAVARIQDPHMRIATNWVEALKRRTPGLSATLPKYRDFWGRPVDYGYGYSAVGQLLSPLYKRPGTPEPIDLELERIEYFPENHPKQLRVTKNQFSATLDTKKFPKIYDRYVELINTPGTHPGFKGGLKDVLNDLAQGKGPLGSVYNQLKTMGNEYAEAEIKRQIKAFREFARQKVLKEFETELRPWFEKNKRDMVPEGT